MAPLRRTARRHSIWPWLRSTELRQGLGHAAGRGRPTAHRGHPDRVGGVGHRAGHRRTAARARVVEIYGPESPEQDDGGPNAVANAQALGGIAAFIDAEHALDPDYAAKLGVDTDELLVSQPDTGEQALEIADMLIRSGAWISWSSTRWPRWSRVRRSRGEWATATSACRPV